ncbi:hypothetical protein LSH36_33g04009 [Paralvinella palmiformis]|uniref:U2A'/phosphoprotein 32 family A C-terminal domain-containing protein n=1 Tax=Paralvinella palmiformis TaxID=53620 RepID=A0AAD9K922_9ANNE|nr:hypothetical protein LSH36_33g04009 [Paralvinella palmiformis]
MPCFSLTVYNTEGENENIGHKIDHMTKRQRVMVKLNEALVLARSRATGLENVRKFNCWGSDLTDIRIIRRMTNVQVLSLSVNKISTLSDVSYCKNLEELYIRKNDVRNLNEICYLKSLPKLRILWLADNPCAAEEQYRMTVLKHLPNLQKLDNVRK